MTDVSLIERIIISIAFFALNFFLPWWVMVTCGTVVIILIPYYVEGVFVLFLRDTLYAGGAAGMTLLVINGVSLHLTAFGVALLILVALGRKSIRKSLPSS